MARQLLQRGFPVLVAVGMVCAPGVARAGTYAVDVPYLSPDINPGDGVCEYYSNNCKSNSL